MTPELLLHLKKFCDTDNTRYALNDPFVRAGWQYWCDARIAARVPSAEPDTVTELRVPRMEYAFAVAAKKPRGKKAVDSPPYNPTWLLFPHCRPCEACGGRGIDLQCHVCKGAGEHYCEPCEAFHKCGCCDGTGTGSRRCESCNSPGAVELFGAEQTRIARHYCEMISALPQAEYAEPSDHEGVLRFRFSLGDGVFGEGIVAAMDKEK